MDTDTANPIERALALALAAHRGQMRKGGDIPYILHPIEIALTLSRAGCEEATVCAGFLHDALEDTSMEIDTIRTELGDRVAELVAFATEPEHRTLPWRQRKQHTVDLVGRTEDREALLLLLADKTANLGSIERDRERLGIRVWDRFHAGREQQAWYYTRLAEAFSRRLGDHDLYREYAAIVDRLFG